MMKEAKAEFGAKTGGKFGDELASRAINAGDKRYRSVWLENKKKDLVRIVESDANRPKRDLGKIVSSAAFEGLRTDYTRMCHAPNGGLLIVYDKQGTGKSYALQAVAREQSRMQPPRFLVINISGADTCQSLYDTIKERVLGDVQDYSNITPTELAEVIKCGLCGPVQPAQIKSLPMTKNACRISIDSQIIVAEKRKDRPILVIDEFVPTDFTWEKDYSLQELKDLIGDAMQFFIALAGEAYTGDGFVAFVGTKSEAFARALNKINGGTKASLARTTTIENPVKVGDFYPFDMNWRGLPWSADDKVKVVRGLFEKELIKALRGQGLADHDVDVRANEIIAEICSRNDRTIRECCEWDMPEAIRVETEKWGAKLQSRAQMSPAAGCIAGVKDLFMGFFGGLSEDALCIASKSAHIAAKKCSSAPCCLQ